MFVSFVVATYNCVDRVPVLNDTVSALSDVDCEFCISDGGSTDGTLDALTQSPRVRVLCSSPDKGIYDAWNRVIDESRGEYLAFIGVDDRPQFDFIALAERRIATMTPRPAVVFGDRILERGRYRRRLAYSDHPLLFESERPVFDIPHQALLNHRSMFERRRFDAGYRLAGDLDFYLAARSDIRERGYLRLPEVQVIAAEDGVSRSPASFRMYRDEYRAIERARDVELGYSERRLRLLGQFERFPGLFKLLKDVSWTLRHDG